MRPRQVQDFIPTPMSIATAMYYTGIDPLTQRARVHGARSAREAHDEGAVLYWDAQHWPLAREALRKAGRRDLIGKAVGCLVPPEHADHAKRWRAFQRGSPQHARLARNTARLASAAEGLGAAISDECCGLRRAFAPASADRDPARVCGKRSRDRGRAQVAAQAVGGRFEDQHDVGFPRSSRCCRRPRAGRC